MQNTFKLVSSYLHGCFEPLAERMEDGAAFLQFEGSRVLAEELGHGVAKNLEFLQGGLHVGQPGLSPLRNDIIRTTEEHKLFAHTERTRQTLNIERKNP